MRLSRNLASAIVFPALVLGLIAASPAPKHPIPDTTSDAIESMAVIAVMVEVCDVELSAPIYDRLATLAQSVGTKAERAQAAEKWYNRAVQMGKPQFCRMALESLRSVK